MTPVRVTQGYVALLEPLADCHNQDELARPAFKIFTAQQAICAANWPSWPPASPNSESRFIARL
jgi:hypothetical protein